MFYKKSHGRRMPREQQRGQHDESSTSLQLMEALGEHEPYFSHHTHPNLTFSHIFISQGIKMM